MGYEQQTLSLHCDRQSIINLSKNQMYHARTKYIVVRYHKIKELNSSSEILWEKVNIEDNTIDLLKKMLPFAKF